MVNKYLSREEFMTIKAALNNNGGMVEPVRVQFTRSWDIVKRIKDSQDFNDFKNRTMGSAAVRKPVMATLSSPAPVQQESRTITDLRIAKQQLMEQFDSVIGTMIKLERGK